MYDCYSVFPKNDIHSFKNFIFKKESLDIDKHESEINESFHYLIFSGKDSHYYTNYKALLGDDINKLDNFFDKHVNKNNIYFNGELIPIDSDFVNNYYCTNRYERGILVPDIVFYDNNFYLRLDIWSNRFICTIKDYKYTSKLFKEICRSLEKSGSTSSITIDLIINYKNLGSRNFRDFLIKKIEDGNISGSNALYASRILFYIYNDFKYSFKSLLLAHTLQNEYYRSRDYLIYRIASEFLLMFNEIEISLYISLTTGLNSYCYRKLWFFYYSRLIDGISENEDKKNEYAKYLDVHIPLDLIQTANIDKWISNNYSYNDGYRYKTYNTDISDIFSLDLFILNKSSIEPVFSNLTDYQLDKIENYYVNTHGVYKDYKDNGLDLSEISLTETFKIMSLLLNEEAFKCFNQEHDTYNEEPISYDDKLKSMFENNRDILSIINIIKIAYVLEMDEYNSLDVDKYINNKVSLFISDIEYKCRHEYEYHYLTNLLRDTDNKIEKPKSLDDSTSKILRLYSNEPSRNESKELIGNFIENVKNSDWKVSYGSESLYRIIVMACIIDDIEYAKYLSSLLYNTLIVENRSNSTFDYYKILYIENKLNGTLVNQQDKLNSNDLIATFNKMSFQIEFNQEINAIKSLDILRALIGSHLTSNRFGDPIDPWGYYRLEDFSKYFFRNKDYHIKYKSITE